MSAIFTIRCYHKYYKMKYYNGADVCPVSSRAVLLIENCSCRSYKFIKVDEQDTFSSKLTTLA